MDVWIIFLRVKHNLYFMNSKKLNRVLGDTVFHSWEVLAKILSSEAAMGIVCDIGMYVEAPHIYQTNGLAFQAGCP